VDNLSALSSMINVKNAIKDETITVSQLNKLAKTLLENNMPITWIQGEISGIRTYSHIYFDLKDESSKISCVLFASTLKLLNFKLENGQKIEVRGKVTIYPQNGSYQINVERVRQLGIGELWEAYTRLLNKLRLEGLFDHAHKKIIPVFPQKIGVITSKEGSVIRDVVTTLKRRMPNIPIIIYHTAVQGVDAAMQITKAIKVANSRLEVDVLIICRGGGSMEDLWCFNEEVVAREVFASEIPIISAVGHETDTTIIDYVSDLRAPTPTGAAELVANSRDSWIIQLNKLHTQLDNSLVSMVNNYKQSLDLYKAKLQVLNPANILIQKIQLLKLYQMRLAKSMLRLFDGYSNKLNMLNMRLNIRKINLTQFNNKLNILNSRLYVAVAQLTKTKNAQLEVLCRNLELVNPSNILSRGYAIVKNESGVVMLSENDVIQHEMLEITLHHGKIGAVAEKIITPTPV